MSEITTPRELFVHELGDILYVERQLADEALPKLISEVQDTEFREALESHLEETRGHVSNVERVFKMLGEEPRLVSEPPDVDFSCACQVWAPVVAVAVAPGPPPAVEP